MLGGAQLDCVGVTRDIQMHNDGEGRGRRKRTSDSGKVLLEEVDEAVGGGVVGVDLCGLLQLRLDLLSQLFSQFDSNSTRGG